MKNRNFIISVSLGVLFFVAIAYSMVLFNSTVNRELEKSVSSTLSDMADQQQVSLSRQIDNIVFTLTSLSETLEAIGVDEDSVLDYVSEKQESLHFQSIMMVDISGMAFSSSREFGDVSQEVFFKESMSGEIYASEPHKSRYGDTEVITVSVPVYSDGVVNGVLAVEYDTDYLDSLLTTFTDARGLNLIINQDSEIMLSTNSFVISFDAFRNATFDNGETFESVVNDFKEGNSGSLSYSINGEKKLGEYRPININGWMLFFEISEESMIESVQNISSSMIFTTVLIIAFAFLSIVYIIISKNSAAKALESVAYYDELTGIPNLIKFKLIVKETLSKHPNKSYTMIKMDMVNFKAINEMFGFDAGNKVICAIAQTGKSVTDGSFVQARVGVEEFMFFAESDFFSNLKESSRMYESRFKTLLPELEEHQFSFRYGRYFLASGETNVNEIINKTNTAHYFAKRDSTNNIWDYDEAFTKKVLKDTEIANKMRKALDNNEFRVYLQPKYSVESRTVSGAEALVRWIDSNDKMIFPNDFIPLFEQNGFIVELDRYMLHNVCKILKSWKDASATIIPVSVNFSRLHLRNPNFVKEIKDIVKSYGIDCKYIEIELTESTVMENEDELRVLIKKLHNEGFLISIDDFGSGYSSLGMLKNFKMDTVKLDRSFFIDVDDADEHSRGDLVVESIVELANKLGMHTVAEGIENKQQEDFLKQISCKSAQGYYFSKPIPSDEFEQQFIKNLNA